MYLLQYWIIFPFLFPSQLIALVRSEAWNLIFSSRPETQIVDWFVSCCDLRFALWSLPLCLTLKLTKSSLNMSYLAVTDSWTRINLKLNLVACKCVHHRLKFGYNWVVSVLASQLVPIHIGFALLVISLWSMDMPNLVHVHVGNISNRIPARHTADMYWTWILHIQFTVNEKHLYLTRGQCKISMSNSQSTWKVLWQPIYFIAIHISYHFVWNPLGIIIWLTFSYSLALDSRPYLQCFK